MAINIILFLSVALSLSAHSSSVRQLLAFNGSHVDPAPPRINPELVPELRQRSAAIVDLNSMPISECPFSILDDCTWQPPRFIPQCPLVSVPCHHWWDTDCKSYTLDCFCNAPVSLSCAWTCGWRGWMYMEDWYSKTCPDTPPVDFRPLPSCARDCISDNSFSYGCITQSKNCFCLNEALFDCPKLCNDPADVEKITNWYATTCGATHAEAIAVVNDQAYSLHGTSIITGKKDIVIPPPKSHKLKWYEILVIFTAVVTVIAAVVCALVIYVLHRSPKYSIERDPFMTDKEESG